MNGKSIADFAAMAGISANTLRLVLRGYAASGATRRKLMVAYESLQLHGLDALSPAAHESMQPDTG